MKPIPSRRGTFLAALVVTVCRVIPLGAAEPVPVKSAKPQPLPGTQPLTLKGDIASQLVAGVDKFLLAEIDKSARRRAKYWKRDPSSGTAYDKSVTPNRKRLANILGVRDRRVSFDAPELVGTVKQPAKVGRGPGYEVFAVRWPAFGDVHGEGLLLVPTGKRKTADAVAIPDADQTPEQIAGLVEGVPAESQYARRLAESGCRVLVPVLINRRMEQRRQARLTNREFLYRSAFELGRHLIGYEVQKVLAAVDWFAKDAGKNQARIGVIGWGEGGLLALYAAGLDNRVNATCVSGYFDDRRQIWQEPIDRNVFGLLDQFGDAEVASLVAPRALVIEAAKGPELTLSGKGGGAPARLVTPKLSDVRKEVERTRKLVAGLKPAPRLDLVVSGEGKGPYGCPETLSKFLDALAPGAKLAPAGKAPQHLRKSFDPNARLLRQIHEIDRHSQSVLRASADVRNQFLGKLKTGSLDEYRKSVEDYRRIFAEEVIGRFDYKLLPFKARTRKAYEADKWTGYEVVLDVFPNVFAYGILLFPKGLKAREKRPVVVCQHGLEGRPQHVIGKESYQYYKAFAARLAERGFITFAPQNLYIFRDRFRTLQRKANPLGKTLFSVITPQHQQIINWLKTLPNVDGKRIGFYGLSYGGKTAMRVPALVTDYCLSICSADFNEWVDKNASTSGPYSYVWGGEYEIFEFDLGSTFNYGEMAALIAPRPFMVERGHFDGVGIDEKVAYEFAKVRHLYAARLGIGRRCAIEWFVGPHTINGKGTFDFLHKHLKWPKR
jgi:dienelactone hydrolase